MKHRTMAVTLGIALLLMSGASASAGKQWCRADPVVEIEGTHIQVLIGVPANQQALVSGPLKVEVFTPIGARRTLLSTDPGFNGYGEAVSFADLNQPLGKNIVVKISVHVPINQAAVKPGQQVQVELTAIVDGTPPVVIYGTAKNAQLILTLQRAVFAPSG